MMVTGRKKATSLEVYYFIVSNDLMYASERQQYAIWRHRMRYAPAGVRNFPERVASRGSEETDNHLFPSFLFAPIIS